MRDIRHEGGAERRTQCLRLDGWWDEWFDGENGWAIPSADSVADPQRREGVEAAALYDLLGLSVAPMFYDRGADGLPRRWLEMVTHTLRTLGPKAQATRMVREYTTELYLPALAFLQGAGRCAGTVRSRRGRARRVEGTGDQAWPAVRIELVETDDGEQSPGARLTVRAGVALGQLTPEDVTVEVAVRPGR